MKLKKVENFDMNMFNRAIGMMGQAKNGMPTKAERMFFELMENLMSRVLGTVHTDTPYISYGMCVPNEIFVGMGLVGFEYDMFGGLLNVYLECQDEIYSQAAALGTRAEICSPQRAPIGWYSKGWFPKPAAFVFSNLSQCDNLAHTGNILGELCGVPTHFVNRPYLWNSERGVKLMAGELKDMITFLENMTGRKMDYDKLDEAIGISLKQIAIVRKIHELAMFSPCPVKSGTGFLIHWIRYAFAGMQEGLDYCEAFLAEVRDMAAAGRGYVPEENYRLISLFTPPTGQHGVLDWLEMEKGAALVAEPYYFRIEQDEVDKVDIRKPLEAVARFYYIEPYYRFYGQMEQYIDMIVDDAIQSKAQGAINWYNAKCRMGGSVAAVIKERLKKEVGIPTLTVDVDILDTSHAVGKNLQKLLDQFLDVIGSKKVEI